MTNSDRRLSSSAILLPPRPRPRRTMDPIVSSALSPEAARPLVAFVAKAPNSVYTINEKVKGSNVVRVLRRAGAEQ